MSILKKLPYLAVFVSTACFIDSACGKPIELNRIRAVVNGEPITQSMVDAAVQTQVRVWLMGNQGMVSRSQATQEIREMESRALDDLIDRKLILTEFERLGGTIKEQYIDESVTKFVQDRFGGDRDKFAQELQETGMTIAQFREIQSDQIAIQALRSQNSGDTSIPNTPWEKKEKYNEIKGEFASEGKVKLRIMSIPKQAPGSTMQQQEAILKDVMSKISSGADFGTLAKAHSADSFAAKGGYVGVIGRGTLNEGLTRAAYAVPPGKTSAPLDDGTHWRILKVEERVGQTAPSYEKLEEEVDKRLSIDKRQKALESWLLKLRRDANVRIIGDD